MYKIEDAEYLQERDKKSGLLMLKPTSERYKILSEAKKLGLFTKNEFLKVREITISEDEYQKL